jgi:dihydrofolate reductase
VITLIVARARGGIIGHQGQIPWANQMAADMRHFRRLTIGHPVIMGRKTYESLPGTFRPLPDRTNIVLSNSCGPPDCIVVASIEEALTIAGGCVGGAEIFVIGGASIYELALPYAERLYVTEIDDDFEGDVSWDHIDPSWSQVTSESHPADANNAYPYRFVTYERTLESA